MPPKKEERNPLIPLFEQTTAFYEYNNITQEEIQKFQEYLTYFKPDLKILLKSNIYENMQILCQQIGLHVHPSFQKQLNDLNDFDENAKFRNPEDIDTEQNPSFISINSIKIDIYTLKLLNLCADQSGITTLKLTNNNLTDIEQQELVQIINNPENHIKKLFFDWQNVEDIILEQIKNIDFLTFRSCNLNTNQIQKLCYNSNNLKCLDLYDNKLQKESFNIIGKMIEENNQLEFLGLAKNNISNLDDIESILKNIGRILMSQEEFNLYKEKEKERDLIIERNKKNKKQEEKVPILDNIQQIENNWYIIKNQQLYLLNLSMNLLDDSQKENIEKFLLQTFDNFQLVLANNKFDDQKGLQRIKKKFGKKLII